MKSADTMQDAGANFDQHTEHDTLRLIEDLLVRQKRVETLVHRQVHDGSRHKVIETMVHRQHAAELRAKLLPLKAAAIARLLEALPHDECLLVWELLAEERGEEIIDELSDALREELGPRRQVSTQTKTLAIHAFEPRDGLLRQIPVANRDELAAAKPVWVDLLAPSTEERRWINEIFGLKLPGANDLTDLEESARYYVDSDATVHLHSGFLLNKGDAPRNIAVAFILHNDVLFSLRDEELPVFRLQRLRARIQPGYASSGKDVLLDLYGADVEYSAAALEAAYAGLEAVGRLVLSPKLSDEQAAVILAEMAKQEDLNGRIRRNVLDTRRALSFLLRSRVLSADQQDDARQILRDIDSLDGHTSFLFGKINFLMDATIGFININQNKRVSKLTTIGVVFTPINIIAGIGGMSEFSMMTGGIPWPLAYGSLTAGLMLMGFVAYVTVRRTEHRSAKHSHHLKANEGPAL
jgi:magnesium transporter